MNNSLSQKEIANELDAFILYNERETNVGNIVKALEKGGVTTYYYHRDLPIGEPLSLEYEKLDTARTIVVFLGDQGWGPTQLRFANSARNKKKRLIPVLIGTPPEEAFEEVNRLFTDIRYLDLRRGQNADLSLLVDAIRGDASVSRRDSSSEHLISQSTSSPVNADSKHYIHSFIEGNTDIRSEALSTLISDKTVDQQALGQLLRGEVERFSDTENETAMAENLGISDPSEISVIRSWLLSALIWADGEAEASRRLILSHIEPSFELHSVVRFWSLASLYQSRASWLKAAVALAQSDHEVDVRTLARTIESPGSEENLLLLKSQLKGREDEVWAALRTLRIVPIPALARDILEFIELPHSETSVTYDALYALSNPDIAGEIAGEFADIGHLSWLIERVVQEAQNASDTAIGAFARLLHIVGGARIEPLLASSLANPTTAPVAQKVRTRILNLDSGTSGAQSLIPLCNSDAINVDQDLLDVQKDVRTFTAVMLSADVVPPLAIGLFGGWGSGKSYFMKSMKKTAQRFASEAKDKPSARFCSKIVQLEFNAWHYADTNLWASLVDHIFRGLDEHVSPPQSEQQRESDLEAEKAQCQQDIAQMLEIKARTQEEINIRNLELESIQVAKTTTPFQVSTFRAADLKSLFKLDAQLQAEVESSLKAIGVPSALNSYSELSTVVNEIYTVRGRLMAWFVALTTNLNRKTILTLLALILMVPLVAIFLIHYLRENATLITWTGVISQVTILFAAATHKIKEAWALVQQGVAKVEAAKTRVEAVIALQQTKETKEEIQLKQEITELKQKLDEAEQLSQEKIRLFRQKEAEIDELREHGSLKHFLADLKAAGEYGKHLGLVTTVRRDFEALQKRLQSNPEIERIILYIDDLDRCSADTVMRVLQAVHLFLAYPLFVVVVGVDPRWLRHALQTTYPSNETSAGQRVGQNELEQSIPRDYLEKIFQIPFNLRPMSDAGYGRLVTELLRPAPAPHEELMPGSVLVPPGPSVLPSEETLEVTENFSLQIGEILSKRDEGSSAASSTSGSFSTPDKNESLNPMTVSKKSAVADYEELLQIQEWESTFASRLRELIPTPRSAKRFVNVYRFIKAQVERPDLRSFEGTSENPGEFRAVMLLLAIMIGFPQESSRLFGHWLDRAERNHDVQSDLMNFDSVRLPAAIKDQLKQLVTPFINEHHFPTRQHLLQKWIPLVSRFSFDLAAHDRAEDYIESL